MKPTPPSITQSSSRSQRVSAAAGSTGRADMAIAARNSHCVLSQDRSPRYAHGSVAELKLADAGKGAYRSATKDWRHGIARELLATNRVLLADGATGTNLFAAGLTAGDPPDLWNIERPDAITGLYRSFVEAGADVILTNTFGANAPRLKLHKAEGPRLRDQQGAARSWRAPSPTPPGGRSSSPARWGRPASSSCRSAR